MGFKMGHISINISTISIFRIVIATVLCGAAQQAFSTIVGAPVPLKESFSITLRGDYVAAGVGFHDQDSGTISLDLPEKATIAKAFLYWSIIDVDESPELTLATLNGRSIEGKLTGATQSCRPEAKILNFRADVTGIAAVGANTVSIASSSSPTLLRRGATLIVIFHDTNAGYREVVTHDGAVSFAGKPKQTINLGFSRALDGTQPEGNKITTTWVVADGQPTVREFTGDLNPPVFLMNNVISVNDNVVAEHALQGRAPGGPFWDTRTDDIGRLVLSGGQPRFGPSMAKLSIESRPGIPQASRPGSKRSGGYSGCARLAALLGGIR